MRSIYLNSIAVLAIVGLAGCGTAGPINPARLEVNDTIRSACLPTVPGLPDQEARMAAMIQLSEADRLNGITQANALANVTIGCSARFAGDDYQKCVTCLIAVVQQVYGQ